MVVLSSGDYAGCQHELKIDIFKGWAKLEMNNVWKHLFLFVTNFFLENVIFNQCNVFEYASLFWGIVVWHFVM